MLFLDGLEGDQKVRQPLNYYSGDTAMVPIAVHRSDASDDAVYLGLKAGPPSGPHGHMDGGSFLIERDNVRWTEDLGIDNYAKIEAAGVKLWDSAQNSDRWTKVFRTGPESHNILRLGGRPQLVKGDARVVKFVAERERQYSELDLSPLYANAAGRVVRRSELIADRGVRIADRITGAKPGEALRWQFCTRAEVKIENGAAILTRNGKTLRVTVEGLPGVRWEVEPVEKWMHPWDGMNRDTRMVSFTTQVPTDGKLAYSVFFR